jgi:hypothetical protein
MCAGDGDCLTDYTCAAGGVCQKKLGTSCGMDADCEMNGVCGANRCCKSSCKKTDDHGCGVGCDMTGECVFTPGGTDCGPAKCSGNDFIPGSKCTGTGTCADEPPVTCPISCTEPGPICL